MFYKFKPRETQVPVWHLRDRGLSWELFCQRKSLLLWCVINLVPRCIWSSIIRPHLFHNTQTGYLVLNFLSSTRCDCQSNSSERYNTWFRLDEEWGSWSIYKEWSVSNPAICSSYTCNHPHPHLSRVNIMIMFSELTIPQRDKLSETTIVCSWISLMGRLLGHRTEL